jgi:hypothetical protein
MRRAKGPPGQGWLAGRVDAADHQRDASRAVLPRPLLGQPTVKPATAPLWKHVAILDRDPKGHRGGLTKPHRARIGGPDQARKQAQDWGMKLLRLTRGAVDASVQGRASIKERGSHDRVSAHVRVVPYRHFASAGSSLGVGGFTVTSHHNHVRPGAGRRGGPGATPDGHE